MKGRINSIQSLGTVDGPGIRFVVFAQGCSLHCPYCHNPETWDRSAGFEVTDTELLAKILNYRDYFGKDGGVTASGGEPLLQAEFFTSLFSLCKSNGITTCLDTSGCLLNHSVDALLAVTDTVLLDVKLSSEAEYLNSICMPRQGAIRFLDRLRERNVPTVLRRVIVGSFNDKPEDVSDLQELKKAYPNVYKIELLPFRKLCVPKYEAAGIPFPFMDKAEPSAETMEKLNKIIK